MHSAQHGSGSPDLTELITQSDRERLSPYLSEHTLRELSIVLGACEASARREILRVVGEEAEAFGDRALILALARVGYAADGHDPGTLGLSR
jgi:hypothetical protein